MTSTRCKAPILRAVEEVLDDEDWEDINEHEKAALITCRPSGWRREQTYVVVRQDVINGMKRLVPVYTVILVSRDDFERDEMELRHRGKQGQENAFKGPFMEMNLHHPRCSKNLANQAYYECALIAHLLIRAIQHRMLPQEARCQSLGYDIRHLIRTVAMLVKQAGNES